MAKKVAVVYGGPSPEAEISRKSGKAVAKALRKLGYEVYELELEPSIARKLEEIKPDKVFPLLHGKPGEDGTFQGLLEILHLPYVGEGVKTSALCMDKDFTKRILVSFGIPTPRWVTLKKNGPLPKDLSFPLVLKPAESGSSVGLKVVKDERELSFHLEELFKSEEKVLLEEFLEGREFTCGFLKGRVLTPLEIVPLKGLYDFEAKYTEGATKFLPVYEKGLKEKIQNLTLKVVDALEISQLCRVDFKTDREGNLFVLEVNTIPGMTETSLLPKMAALEGIDFESLVSLLIE